MNNNENNILKLMTICSVALLITRAIFSQSFMFFFLPWNLFLAWIPLCIINYSLKLGNNSQNITKLTFFILWWLFLPNAPYMITDLIHLKLSSSRLVWIDIILIYMFSISGLMMGYLSLKKAHFLLRNIYQIKHHTFIIYSAVLSCGFGIFLGRIERLNSWDMMLHPFRNVKRIITLFVHPDLYVESWSFSLWVGVFLLILYYIFTLNAVNDQKEKSFL